MPTTIFENARVHTDLTSSSAPPQALLVIDGRIARIGSVRECRDSAPVGTKRIDLGRGHVAPAFTDAHVHTVQLATRSLEADVSGAGGFEQLAELAGGLARGGAPLLTRGWVLGAGWNAGAFSDRRPARLDTLDRLTRDVPVALHSADLHAYWLNTAALGRLGLDPAHTQEGLIAEAPAFAVQHQIERTLRDTLADSILDVLRRLSRVGIAAIHDIDDRIARTTFQTLADEHALPVRVHKVTIDAELDEVSDAGIRTGSRNGWLEYGGVKLFSDGALGSHTCHLSEPFTDLPDSYGLECINPAELQRTIAHCVERGFSVAVHAIGDAAVRSAAIAIAAAPTGSIPHRIEHAQHIRPQDLDLVARSGAVAVMQPESCTSDIDMVGRRLGQREMISYGWRTLRDRGMTVAFSSDAPVEGFRPLHGIHAATTRQRPDGTPAGGWQPHERLTRAEAWDAYTGAPAVASGHADDRGALEVGMLADFIVLDRDPRLVDDLALRDAQVLRTVVGGTTQWDAADPTSPHTEER